MNRYDESTVYLTVTNKYPRSQGEPRPVEINITEADSHKWEEMDDAIEFAGHLAAELPGVWAVYIGHSVSWVLQRDDGLKLRIYNRRMVRCTVEIPEAYDGGNPWTSTLWLRDDDPQDVPEAQANRNRGIKAIAADFNRRVIVHADAVWATALRYVREKAAELAIKEDTATRVADAFGTIYRAPDGKGGYYRAEAGCYPTRAEFRLSYDSHTQFTVHISDPAMAVRVAKAIKEAMWPSAPEQDDQVQLGLFQEGEAFPLFQEMAA